MRKSTLILITLAVCLATMFHVSGNVGAEKAKKTTTLKGTVFRGDKDHPVAGALITLMDEKKSGNEDHSVETKADDKGAYSFENVADGKYTVSIRTWYDTQEAVPCQLLVAKTADKDSSLVVMHDKDKFVEQVFIKGFGVKAGKENIKDFDIACKSAFAK